MTKWLNGAATRVQDESPCIGLGTESLKEYYEAVVTLKEVASKECNLDIVQTYEFFLKNRGAVPSCNFKDAQKESACRLRRSMKRCRIL